MRNIVRLLVFFLVVALLGCGHPRPDVDDNQVLNALGFKQLMFATIQFNPNNGEIQTDGSFNLAALYTKAGYLRVVPDTASSPWYSLTSTDVTTAAYSNGAYILAIGKREIGGRSNERYWTENSVQYYAETISYSIDFPAKIKSALDSQIGAFQVRLVFANDPAVGSWKLSERSDLQSLSSDRDAVVSGLVAEGAKYAGTLSELLVRARKNAFDQIEHNLAASNVLERAPDNNEVLINKSRHLAYLARPVSISHPPANTLERWWASGGAYTLAEVEAYCAGVHTPHYQNWHAPSAVEMDTVVIGGPNPRLIDAPDGRLWGQLAVPTIRGGDVESDTFVTTSLLHRTDESGGDDVGEGFITYVLYSDGRMVQGFVQWGPNMSRADIESHFVAGRAKVICVSTLN